MIDLNGDIYAQIAIIKLYRRRISRIVFISYPRTLSPLVDGLTYALQADGFKIWVDYGLRIDDNFQEPTFKAIDKAAEEGYVLYLIDCDRYGEGQRRVLYYALKKSALVIPVIVAGETLPDEFICELGHIPWLDVRHLPEIEQIEAITQALIEHNLSLNVD